MTTFSDQAAAADTYIANDTPTTNYGTGNSLANGEWNGGAQVGRVLLKFDLSSIPTSATVISATLSLWVVADYADNTRVHRVFRTKRAWTEMGATWNKYDGTNDWQTAGGFGANDCEQTDIGNTSIANNTAVGTEVQFALAASSVEAMIDGTFTNNGFMLKADTEMDDMWAFVSAENASAAQRPKLVIEYVVGGNVMWWY